MPRRIPARSPLYCEKGEREIRQNDAVYANSAIFLRQELFESLKDRPIEARNRSIHDTRAKEQPVW
jgi:hypothetical protein